MKAGIEKATLDIKELCRSSGSSCKTPILEYTNTESSPNIALELFKKAYSNGARVFVGLVTSAEAKAVAEYAQENATDALLFSPTSTSTELCKYKDQLYRLTMDDRGYAEVLFDIAFQFQVKKVIVIYRKDVYGEGLYYDIAKRFSTEKDGFEMLDPISYSEGDLTSQADAQTIVKQLDETLPSSDEQVIVVLVGFVEVEHILQLAADSDQYPKFKNCIWMLSDALALSDIKLPAKMNIFSISFFGTEPESGQVSKEHHGLVKYIHDKGLPPLLQGFLAYDAISWIQMFYLNSQSFSQYVSSNMVSEGLTGALEFSVCHERLSGSYTLVVNPNVDSVDNLLVKVVMDKWMVISQNRVQSKQQYNTNSAMMYEQLTAEAMMERNLQSTSKGDVSAVSTAVIEIMKSDLLKSLVKIGKKKCKNTAQISIRTINELTHERINTTTYTKETLPETVTVPARMGMIMEGSCNTGKNKIKFSHVCSSAKVAGAKLMCKTKIKRKSKLALYSGQTQNAIIEGKKCSRTRVFNQLCYAGAAGCSFIPLALPYCLITLAGCGLLNIGNQAIFCDKGKYVCTELFRQGLLSSELLLADMSFAEHYSDEYPLTRQGYNIIGPALASWMSTSETVTDIVKSFAIPWAEEMAYNEGYYDKGNEVGAWVMSIGSVICAFVGIVYTYASSIIG